MKYYYQALLLFVIPVCSFAQSNFKPGYVVTLKGDTLHGYVDYQEWNKNPVQIKFKRQLTDKEADRYSATDANAFAVDGFEYYERYSLPISKGQTDVSKLSIGVDTSKVIGNVFLQLVSKGKNVSLYNYKDDIKTRYYVKESVTALPVELIYQVYLDPSDASQIVTQPKFQNQLYVLASNYHKDNDKLTKRITLAEYKERDLIDIVNIINGAEEQKSSVAKGITVNFFAGAGLVRGNLSYSGDIPLSHNSVSAPVYSPKINLGIDIPINPNVRRFIMRMDLSFSGASYKINTTSGLYASHQFSQFTGSLTPQVLYNIYNTDDLKFYVDAGISLNLSSYSRNQYNYADEPYSGTTIQMDNYPQMAPLWVAFSGRIGMFIKKKFELSLSYSPPATVTDHYVSIYGEVSSTQLGINYFFN